ncbi:hypothetical protein [Paenibacillus donghaensis]|uniref:hypothetical protein n=1 Tax=Paenibacillus donghaensis TaxID=414771 RepID=UPI0012FD935E|nr:hypothetical protein [Paenibacillus donghaensis]
MEVITAVRQASGENFTIGIRVRKVENGDPLATFDPELVLRPDAKIKDFEIVAEVN